MPIYEYECTSCHHHFDVLQKISEDPIKICPECNKPHVERLVSAAGFQLKGTGWYVTDFRDKGKPKPKDEKPASKDTADTTPTKESKKTTEDKS